MKSGDGWFPNLSKVAKLVLTIPHSNAEEERVLSLVRMNKPDYLSRLKLDGTLSSIMTVKLNDKPCYKFEPSDSCILSQAKKATMKTVNALSN